MLAEIFLNGLTTIFHRLPIKSGLTNLSLNPIVNRLMAHAPPVTLARLRDGNLIEVSTVDHDGRILYLFGTNDPKVAQTACALLNMGDVFLDIGANYSSIGLAVSHVVGPEGSVHLFEPQKLIGDRVQQAINAGRYTNVKLHRIGLMDCDGKFLLHSPSSHSGMATFDNHEGTASFDNVEECEVKEIGAHAAPLVSGRPFGAKLDVEGAEPKLLPWLLAQANLRFLIFEAARNQSQLFDSVRAAGFNLFGLKRNVLRLRLLRIDALSELSHFHDLAAIRIPKGGNPPKESTPRQLSRLIAKNDR